MSKKITKSIQVIAALNEVAWYEKEKGNLEGQLSSRARWDIKRNMKELGSIAKDFYEFRDAEDQKIRDKYLTDEKSEETKVTDENGNEVDGRKVKDEYLEDLRKDQAEAQAKLNEILNDTEEVALYMINIEAELDRADEKGFDISDATMDMLSLFVDEEGE